MAHVRDCHERNAMKGGTHARSEKEETYGQGHEEDREAHDAQIDWTRAQAANHQKDDSQVEDVMS